MTDATRQDETDARNALRKLVDRQRFLMHTSIAADGSLESRPMTVQEWDGWQVRFIAQRGDDVVLQSDGSQVNLTAMDGGVYLSLSGTGSVSDSVAEKRELWDRINASYAGEPTDPENVILTVSVDTGAYWDAGNLVTRLVGLAKAAVTGDPPEGEHGDVDLRGGL